MGNNQDYSICPECLDSLTGGSLTGVGRHKKHPVQRLEITLLRASAAKGIRMAHSPVGTDRTGQGISGPVISI